MAGKAQLAVPPTPPPAGITTPQEESSLFQVSTSTSNRPEHRDQFSQGIQHVLGVAAPQHCAGIGKEPRDPGEQRGNGRRGLKSPRPHSPASPHLPSSLTRIP